MPLKRKQIELTPEEQLDLLANARKLHAATIGPDGQPHLIPIWFVLVDDAIVFTTYGKSQKIANLERDPRITLLGEDGDSYSTLRGVSLETCAEVIRDPLATARVLVKVNARYMGAAEVEVQPGDELPPLAYKRVVVRVPLAGARVRSWDHRKM